VQAFPTQESVNEALRSLLPIAERTIRLPHQNQWPLLGDSCMI
jgi:hypothetical protein